MGKLLMTASQPAQGISTLQLIKGVSFGSGIRVVHVVSACYPLFKWTTPASPVWNVHIKSFAGRFRSFAGRFSSFQLVSGGFSSFQVVLTFINYGLNTNKTAIYPQKSYKDLLFTNTDFISVLQSFFCLLFLQDIFWIRHVGNFCS